MLDNSDRVQHCPFLNRTDSRCGSHFTLERLEHAFEYCFDRYAACPVYQELLIERRVRRGEARLLHDESLLPVGAIGERTRANEAFESTQDEASHAPDRRPLVEITIHSRRLPKIAALGSRAPKRAA